MTLFGVTFEIFYACRSCSGVEYGRGKLQCVIFFLCCSDCLAEMTDEEAAQWLWSCGYDLLAMENACHVIQAFINRCAELLNNDDVYPNWRITTGCREWLAFNILYPDHQFDSLWREGSSDVKCLYMQATPKKAKSSHGLRWCLLIFCHICFSVHPESMSEEKNMRPWYRSSIGIQMWVQNVC